MRDMAATSEFVPLATLLETLDTLCGEKRTGRIHITTPDNHAATLVLANGDIVASHYRVRRGESALRDIERLSWLRFTFVEGTVRYHNDEGLPPTAVILHRLENALMELRHLSPSPEDTADE
jgi:hypothetical protein